MSRCIVKGIGLAAPGLAGWSASVDILRGAVPYLPIAETAYAPALLPPNERRRAAAAVRQAFRAAEDAVTVAGADARSLASVFASSDADMTVLHRICAALAQSPRVVSPTDFHNSVHNAASGYWSIGAHSMEPTTSLSAYDATFAASLIEAVALVQERGDVLAVTYDAIAPSPLLAKRPMAAAAGVALILGRPEAGAAGCGHIDLALGGHGESICASPSLESLRTANPALRALPLLELLAARRTGSVTLRATGELRITLAVGP
jgi:hypothetical protein